MILVTIGLAVISASHLRVEANNKNQTIERAEKKMDTEKYAIEDNTITCSYRKNMNYPSIKNSGKILSWTPIEKNADTYLQWQAETDQNLELAWEGFTFDFSPSDIQLLIEKDRHYYQFIYGNDTIEITLKVAQQTGNRSLTIETEDNNHTFSVLGDGEVIAVNKKGEDMYTDIETFNHYQFIIDEETFNITIPAKLNAPETKNVPSEENSSSTLKPPRDTMEVIPEVAPEVAP